MENELEIKTGRLVAMLERSPYDAVLLNAQHNFVWLTGGSNGVDLSRENGAATLLITSKGRRFVLASRIEMARVLAEEVSERDFEPVEFRWQDGNPAQSALRLFDPTAKLGSDVVLAAGVDPIEYLIGPCRFELTGGELERYRKLGADAGAAMGRVIGHIEQDETEIAIAEKLRHEFAQSGMTSIVTLIAADDRIARFRHPIPTDNTWQKTVLLVTCARRGGLIASLSRMVTIGPVPDDLAKLTEKTAFVNASILDTSRPGATGSELYATAEKAYAQAGRPEQIDLHHQGGAAGYRSREWVANPASNEVVHLHQAFAWNPSITGTKVEETCIVVDGGVETITETPGFPRISTLIGGREYFSPGIFSI